MATAPPPPKGRKLGPFLEVEQSRLAVVDVVQQWSVAFMISLIASKSEVSTFSKDTKDAKHQPTILVGGKAIKLNPILGCLGQFWTCSYHSLNTWMRLPGV